MATLDRPLTFRTRHGRFTVRHASLMPAVLRYVRTLDAVIERRECGANAKGGGGFQPGNTCGKGDGGGGGGPEGGVSVSQKGTFLQASTEGGVVGGHVKDGAIRISVAQLSKEKQGQGLGKAMYKSLIDEAHSQGLKVFSDTTVEVPAVRVYQSLAKDGYEIITNDHGVLPPSEDAPQGAWFGKEGKPVFEVRPKNKGGASAGGGGVEPHAPVTKEHSQQARALSSGVKNSYARKLAEEAYAQHLANGGKAPEIVSHKFSGYKATAMYSQSNDKIYVNASVSAKSEEAFRRSVESGFLSQPNPILHELGHKVHADALGNSYDSAKNHVFSAAQKEKISKEVSKYAATNGLEFAAEVYAGVGAGKKYSDEVLRMFASVTQGKVLLRGPAK